MICISYEIHTYTHGHLSCTPIPMSIYPPPVISPGKSTRSSNERSSGKPLRTKRSRRSYRARSKLILGLMCEIDVFGFGSKTGVVWCGMVTMVRWIRSKGWGDRARFRIFHPLNWTSCRTNFWGTTPRHGGTKDFQNYSKTNGAKDEGFPQNFPYPT